MESSLNVYHILKAESQTDFDVSHLHPTHVVFFETCLRKIWITHQTFKNVPSDVDVFKDKDAYHFLLEVLCGLQSPVVGETEVFGQFKNQVVRNLDSQSSLSKVIKGLIADTKDIRSRHLINLGSSSYGSLARKYLTGYANLDILGAGQFVQSLKPWVEKLKIQTNVYTRDPKSYLKVYEGSKWNLKPLVEFSPYLADAPKALFVCAPIDLQSLDLSVYDLVIDFRDSSHLNSVSHQNLKNLVEIFEEIQKDNILAEQKKKEALSSVENASHLYATAMNHRPFGWDDLSA